jgi:deazaflavin-dependent oxidoreductase (nitroreductase family)
VDWNERIIEQFRSNGGHVDNFGTGLVLLHHTGAKSGTVRVSPVMGLPEGDDAWLIAASKGGAPENPGWFHNLVAHPDVEIETPDGTVAVHAEVLEGTERDRGWARFTAASDGFRQYEQRTSRTIPVVRLTRR